MKWKRWRRRRHTKTSIHVRDGSPGAARCSAFLNTQLELNPSSTTRRITHHGGIGSCGELPRVTSMSRLRTTTACACMHHLEVNCGASPPGLIHHSIPSHPLANSLSHLHLLLLLQNQPLPPLPTFPAPPRHTSPNNPILQPKSTRAVYSVCWEFGWFRAQVRRHQSIMASAVVGASE